MEDIVSLYLAPSAILLKAETVIPRFQRLELFGMSYRFGHPSIRLVHDIGGLRMWSS